MAYTNVWNASVPPNTDLAKNIALDMRNIRQDILDRMNDQFVVDWTTDPIVPQAKILGNVNNKVSMIPGSSFNENFSTAAYGNSSLQSTARSQNTLTSIGGSVLFNAQPPNLFGYCPYPNGATITAFGFFVKNNNINVSCRAWVFDNIAGTITQLGSSAVTIAPSSGVNKNGQVLVTPFTVGSNTTISLEVFSSDPAGQGIGFVLLSGYLIYNTPDCRSTI